MKLKYLILAPVMMLTACTLAPLSNPYTARTLGPGKWDVNGGASVINVVQPYLQVSRGITKNLDIGAVGEIGDSVVGGAWAKYAVLNSPSGLAVALVASSGYTGGRYKLSGDIKGETTENAWYVYGGPIISYKMGWLEPYVVGRYNYITSGATYGQITAGTNMWLSNQFGININGSGMFGKGGHGYFATGGVIYRF